MNTSTPTLRAFIVLIALAGTPLQIAAQGGQPRVRGQVADASEGVLPGVTVTASKNGRVMAVTATDGSGAYQFTDLLDGAVTLTFELTGFDKATVTLELSATDLVVPVQHLAVATLIDTVVVVGNLPVVHPAPPLPPVPQPSVLPVPEHDRESVCGPSKSEPQQQSLGTIIGRRYSTTGGALFAKGDELTIKGGSAEGLAVGQNLAVRRTYRVSGATRPATAEHTAGLLQIVSIDEHFANGVVVYACDEIMIGDFLAAVTPEPIRDPDPAGFPVYAEAARILFADDGQMLGAPRRLMVIDRGSDEGFKAGQRVTLFHRDGRGSTPSVVGEAVVVAVRPTSATIRIERAIDIVAFGDWAAPQRQPSARQQ